MVSRDNKRFFLSLRLILIASAVVIFIVLGFGIWYIQNLSFFEVPIGKVNPLRQSVLEELRENQQKSSIPTEINLKKNESKVIPLGVKNTKAETIRYFIKIEVIAVREGEVSEAQLKDQVEFMYDTSSYSL